MRTTILLSTLLFLAGSALAQDSPITVGDSSSIPGLPGKKAAPSKQPKEQGKKAVSPASTFVGYSEFQFDGPNKIHHVTDKVRRAACLTADPTPKGLPPKVSLIDNKWSLALNGDKKVELRSAKDGNRVEIDIHDKQGTIYGVVAGKVNVEVPSYPPTSASLTVGSTTYSYPSMGSDYQFFIHYCQIKGKVVDCTDSTGKDACQ